MAKSNFDFDWKRSDDEEGGGGAGGVREQDEVAPSSSDHDSVLLEALARLYGAECTVINACR